MGYIGNYGNTPLQSGLGTPQYEKSGFNPIRAILDAIRGDKSGPGPSYANALLEHMGMMQAPGTTGAVGDSAMADRTAPELAGRSGADGGPQGGPMTPIEALMAQIMGGGSKASIRAAIAPQQAAINTLQNQLGQVGAQTDQNVADIGSWFGQAADMSQHNAKVGMRSSRKARKGEKALGAGLLQGIADPNVSRAVAGATGRHTGSIMRQGLENAAFDRHQASDATEQGAYQALVQQRLGAQAEAGIRDQLAQAQAAKVAAKQSAKGGDIGQLMQLLGLFGDSPIVDKYLMGGGFDPALIENPNGAAGGYGLEQGSALNSALNTTPFFGSDASGGKPAGGLQDLLKMAYGTVAARGLDINDPQVQQAIRAYIQSHVATQYNEKQGTNWHLNDQGSFFTQK